MSENTNTITNQNRLRSKVLWVAVGAQVVSILGYTGVLNKIGITSDVANAIIIGVCQILALVGVFNNPTDGGAW